MTTHASAPDLTPVHAELATIGDHARALVIADQASCEAAAQLLRRIKRLRTTIANLFAPHIARAADAHRALLADRRRFDAPLLAAEQLVKRAIAAFTIADEAQRRQEASTRTVAAEQQRADAVWQEVTALTAAGHDDDAATIVGAFVRTPSPIVLPDPRPAIEGIACRTVWRFTVVNLDEVPDAYWTLDHQKLSAVVRATKGALAIPGVQIWAERVIAAEADR
jgi:hypothetical protein